MGKLTYGPETFELGDRLLAHLQLVISTKLRRKESFMLIWRQPTEIGSGRQTLWIDNGVPIHFFFDTKRAPQINRQWFEQMIVSASAPGGLVVGDEPIVGASPED